MLPDDCSATRRRSSALPTPAAAILLLAMSATIPSACSTVPDPELPPHRDHTFHARYLIGDDGRLAFPCTTRSLVIRDVQLTPKPIDERFDAETRWFLYPAGTTVHARGHLRAYAAPSGNIPQLSDLLPNAKLLQGKNAQ